MKLVLIITAAFFSMTSRSAEQSCAFCPAISELESEMTRVKPEPLNQSTAEKQEAIVGKAEDIAKDALTEEHFNKLSAKPVVMMIARTLPYDVSANFGRSNTATFKKLYFQKKSLLKSTLENMLKRRELSNASYHTILQTFDIESNANASLANLTTKPDSNFVSCDRLHRVQGRDLRLIIQKVSHPNTASLYSDVIWNSRSDESVAGGDTSPSRLTPARHTPFRGRDRAPASTDSNGYERLPASVQ